MKREDDAYLVRADRVWDGHTESARGPMSVLVRAGRVVHAHFGTVDLEGVEVIDLPGQTLLPGLIDCHVHVIDEALDTGSVAYQVLRALPALQALLAGGFTTVRDLGGASGPLNVGLRRAVDEGIVSGPRMIVAPNMLSTTTGHGDKTPGAAERYGYQVGTLADGADEVLRAVRRQARAGADWIKFAGSGGLTSPADELASSGFTASETRALVGAARDQNLPCAVHAMTDQAVRRAVEAGVRSVEHGWLVTPDTLRLMADQGTWLVPTQYALSYFTDRLDDDAFWPDRSTRARDDFRRIKDRVRENFALLSSHPVRIAFGTDAGMFPHRENWREFPTLVANGFSPLRALRSATRDAAALLERPDLGHIAPGATADLIAVRGDPLSDIDALGRVTFVMRDGRPLPRPEPAHPQARQRTVPPPTATHIPDHLDGGRP